MLRHTFLHLRGVGPRTEARFWREGVITWEDALGHPLPWLAPWHRELLRLELAESCRRLGLADALYFQALLPPAERWRLLAEFLPQAVCLDIETTGLAWGMNVITVIGIYDGREYRAFVRGRDLHLFPEAVRRYRLLITYNGLRFDVPFIEAEMGPVLAGMAHLDLMYVLRRLGLRGGLKRVEQLTGLARPSALQGLGGYHAVVLWRLHRQGHQGALDTLIRYNAEDVVGLLPLAVYAYNLLTAQLPVPVAPLPLPERPHLPLPYDPSLVKWLLDGEETREEEAV
ncbi:MAG TPA: ribonuclease H-like domain-containing protein [Dehalococcoidia bacterium]|nr:ribonuclease H-like domain-containing protein [Dehalococcoidia bacterium]